VNQQGGHETDTDDWYCERRRTRAGIECSDPGNGEAINKLRIVVAEGVTLLAAEPTGKVIPSAGPGSVANTIAYTLREMLQKETRMTVLGHVRRGDSPTPFDRILGTRLGVAATDLAAQQQFGRMVCLKAGKMDAVSLDEALQKMKYIDPDCEIVHAVRPVGTTFGDGR
jgi:ATP-dependent phosphofructokinase / diphosphate-dependent phosphofructokinase